MNFMKEIKLQLPNLAPANSWMLFFDKGNGSLAGCQGNSIIVGLWNAAKDVAAILETLIIYLWMGGMVTLLQCVSL